MIDIIGSSLFANFVKQAPPIFIPLELLGSNHLSFALQPVGINVKRFKNDVLMSQSLEKKNNEYELWLNHLHNSNHALILFNAGIHAVPVSANIICKKKFP